MRRLLLSARAQHQRQKVETWQPRHSPPAVQQTQTQGRQQRQQRLLKGLMLVTASQRQMAQTRPVIQTQRSRMPPLLLPGCCS